MAIYVTGTVTLMAAGYTTSWDSPRRTSERSPEPPVPPNEHENHCLQRYARPIVASDSMALVQYLSGPDEPRPEATWVCKSSYWALLQDARGAAGRDLRTGEVRVPEHSASWLAAMGYLCWFDQLGSAIRRRDRPLKTGRYGFFDCLIQFSDLSGDERDALWGLRSSFAHDYSLIREDTKSGKHYLFELDVHDAPLIQLPGEPWGGGEDTGGRHQTVVGMRALGDFAEGVQRTINGVWQAGDLLPATTADDLCWRP